MTAALFAPGATTAAAGTDDGHATRTGALLGTLRYMAPEQFEGGDADARSDVFSFGALLFEMLTGKYAFDGRDVSAVRTAILCPEPPAVSSVEPLVPCALDTIVGRCLSANPDDRWQTAADVVRELQHVRDLVGARAARPAAVAKARHAWKWSAATLLVVLLGLAAWKPATGSHGISDGRADRVNRRAADRERLGRSRAGIPRGRYDGAADRRSRGDCQTPADLGRPSCITSWRRSRCRRLPGNSRSTQSSRARSSGAAIGSA